MIRLFLAFIIASGAITSLPAQTQTLSPQAMESEGQRIASELRASFPAEESNIRAVLEIRPRRSKVVEQVPVIFSVLVQNDHWDAVYETGQTATRGSEKLIVRHYIDRPNRYFYAKAPFPKAALPDVRELQPHEADIPLAGSDFWLTDLGIDFLHWSVQRRVKGEMRMGQWCHVLESVFPGRPNLNRVVSWIDRDSADAGIAGILAAEAYAPDGKRVKEFSLSGSSFKKIKGQWQLERMQITDVRTGSRTTLRFDLRNPETRTLSTIEVN
ncbi:MAG: outer membrane lipoprotein-sorting protein [Limisphaerales bacterium]